MILPPINNLLNNDTTERLEQIHDVQKYGTKSKHYAKVDAMLEVSKQQDKKPWLLRILEKLFN
jgi:cell fate (sporulation/competence/biofilm development) regulator YmcA (YheA/YmcA/DUF963 family)